MVVFLQTLMALGDFFRSLLEYNGKNVINSMNQLFEQVWILLNFNLVNVTLIPKQHGAEFSEHYRPLALANFQFIIITNCI